MTNKHFKKEASNDVTYYCWQVKILKEEWLTGEMFKKMGIVSLLKRFYKAI